MCVLDMPKKKQVIFQTSIPGKFIPRDDPLPGSGSTRIDFTDSFFLIYSVFFFFYL
mgnify:FL=1